MRDPFDNSQMLSEYNYLMDSLTCEDITEEEDKKKEKPVSTNIAISMANELLASIIDKSKKIMDERDVDRLCRKHDIYMEKGGNIVVKNNVFETMNNFIDNLTSKGDNITKIMLHNIAHKNDLTPLVPIFNAENRTIFVC